MLAAKLYDLLTIQIKSTTKNSIAEIVEVWTDYKTVYCSESHKSTNESFTSEGERIGYDKEFIIRYTAEITPINSHNYRVIFNEEEYDIKDVYPVNRVDYLILKCTSI